MIRTGVIQNATRQNKMATLSNEALHHHTVYRAKTLYCLSGDPEEMFNMQINQGRKFHHYDDDMNSGHVYSGRKRRKNNTAKIGGSQDDIWDAFLLMFLYWRLLIAGDDFVDQYRHFITPYHPIM